MNTLQNRVYIDLCQPRHLNNTEQSATHSICAQLHTSNCLKEDETWCKNIQHFKTHWLPRGVSIRSNVMKSFVVNDEPM